MRTREPGLQARRDRNDLLTGVIVGALAIGFLLFRGVNAVVSLFAAPGAITVESPLPAQEVTTRLGNGATATITSGTLVVADVSTISVVSLVVAIILSTIGLVAAAALGVATCIRLLRGHVFDQVNVRLLFALSMSLLLAWVGDVWFRNMGLNGVFAALGDEFRGQTALNLDGVSLFVAAIAVGVLVIVFRRGAALQRETEGLV
ncbi:hypothetical protein [Microbacterium abyssi]|uniref:hypothetical protein n=1 Tax=Microbacterium abyssi TaxID=2782166 RepID=UPI0018892D35|nr:hypothetical protein [Microbacterium sp. A18JL241]